MLLFTAIATRHVHLCLQSYQLLHNINFIQESDYIFCHSCMCIFELNELMFFVKSLKAPTARFNICQYGYDHVHFAINSTRSASCSKLTHSKPVSSTYHHFYIISKEFIRLWNHMPTVDLSHPYILYYAILQASICKHRRNNNVATCRKQYS